MKKIVIMSDNHGDMNMLTDIKVLEDDADYYIHCGDSESYSRCFDLRSYTYASCERRKRLMAY